jgi:hypothetical protein
MQPVRRGLNERWKLATVQQVPLAEPWLAKRAAELDSISFQEFLDQTIGNE